MLGFRPLLILAAALPLCGCAPSAGLGEARCDAVAAHIVGLREAAGQTSAFAPQPRTLSVVCQQSMGETQAACILGATHYADIQACSSAGG
ncbi:MAG: hypothetical protein KDG50_06435 [Chromatiales bacterium]|nr:hypothetical protein [Chromatiales bacterium]